MRQKLGNRLWSGFLGSLAFAVVTMGLMSAQVPTATITGVVKDATGALVPNVKVTATNTSTNLSREAVTDESGTYRIPALNPGPYRLEAQASGFKNCRGRRDRLEVGQQVRVDVELQVGEFPSPSR